MSANDNPFRFSPTLQYMATVETIATLLRNSDYPVLMKNASRNIFPDHYGRGSSHLNPMPEYRFEEIDEKVDRLPVPEVVKINLKRFLVLIADSATKWLLRVVKTTPLTLNKKYCTDRISELVTHLQWDNFGCVDGRKTLESYVSRRQTIDFFIWNQLCFHCMQDEIIKFSKTIDWKKCKGCFNSAFSAYWYRKIYNGKLPTYEMHDRRWRSCVESYGVDSYGHQRAVSRNKILRSMLYHSYPFIPRSGRPASAIMYFRNKLKDQGNFDNWVARSDNWDGTDEVALYLLRTIKRDTLLRLFSYDSFCNSLMRSPLILLIDDWISVFESVKAGVFILFFKCINMLGMELRNDYNKSLYEPFEKVWGIFHRRFSSEPKIMRSASCTIFFKNDIILCRLMFKELDDHQRIPFIEGLINHREWNVCRTLHRNFYAQFLEQVLKNDEERKLFSEISNYFIQSD